MLIPCPFCGEREVGEFVYRGDAAVTRPAPDTGPAAMVDYVYLRTNPAGPLAEHWYHAHGCRNWLVLVRDTRTHAIEGARFAQAPERRR